MFIKLTLYQEDYRKRDVRQPVYVNIAAITHVHPYEYIRPKIDTSGASIRDENQTTSYEKTLVTCIMLHNSNSWLYVTESLDAVMTAINA